jgi:hypothetical protein
MLPYVNARTKAQFKGVPGAPELTGIAALYEETCTQFGTYLPDGSVGWGCVTNASQVAPPRAHGASQNTFIRFHWTGSLELALLVLDLFEWAQNKADLEKYIPIALGVVEGYRQRFPHKDANGATDMFPAQALETYQCADSTSREDCPSNPSNDIAGLMAVLPRLIALPASVVTAAQKAAWKAQLELLPPLPLVSAAKSGPGTFNKQKVAPIATGDGFPTSGAGKRHNSENTENYIAHPFRLFGIGKPTDISLAQQTYLERHNPCNDGWCQDLIQAAMLNMTDDAAAMVAARASATDHGGFRFEGFAGHYQDYMPSLDHYGFMRTGLDYMLMSTVDDSNGTVLLFPAFPVQQWNVRFKMHAPRNTTIEASCQEGKLEYLIVTPPERRSAITVMNCAE